MRSERWAHSRPMHPFHFFLLSYFARETVTLNALRTKKRAWQSYVLLTRNAALFYRTPTFLSFFCHEKRNGEKIRNLGVKLKNANDFCTLPIASKTQMES